MANLGDTLRQARAYKGVTLKEAELATRINRHHLAALEDENFAALPAAVIYQRGFVRNYAAYLGLDAHTLLAMFDEAQAPGGRVDDVVVAVKPLNMPSHWAPNFAIIAFLVVMSAIVFAWFYSAYFAPDSGVPTATAIPTLTAMPLQVQQAPIMTPERAETATLPADETAPGGSPAAGGRDRASGEDVADAGSSASSDTVRSRATATATETEEVEAEPTKAPTATETPDAAATGEAEGTAAASATAEARTVAATQTAFADVSVTLSFAARDVGIGWLTVVADGQTVFEGSLAAGQETEKFSAISFSVYTTDVATTYITNHDTGAPEFVMPGSGQQTLTLP